MRVLLAAAVVTFAFAAITPTSAADLVGAPGTEIGVADGGFVHEAGWSGDGVRAGKVTIFDDQPGVITRAWFLPPWHRHHYFPATGARPGIGRYENLSARYPLPPPAQGFYRSWSTNALFVREPPRLVPARALDDEGVPRRGRAPASPVQP